LFFFLVLGEPFTQEEMEEMLSQAVDPEKGFIPYKDYASLMAAEES
jgi:Ca2+-binding EF-hand superfamily protein